MKCEQCDSVIVGKNASAKYCSDRCKAKTRHKRSAARVGYYRYCAQCSKPFETRIGAKRFCSKICLKRRDNRIQAIKQGRTFYPRHGPKRPTQESINRLAVKNAGQAWKYWINVKAPDNWVDEYYESTGKPWQNPRLSDTEGYRLQYQLDTDFMVSERIRAQINKRKKRTGIGDIMRMAINRGSESKTANNLLGYSIKQLTTSLERQFTRGMDWDRFRKGDIHIDHIVPQKEFDLLNADEWRECWSLSNLQPLWARDNLSKSSKKVYLI